MGKISFWSLLNSNKVVIPIIQRDYAQGRDGKEHIREKFLTQIKNALEDQTKSGELDFVYGTTKGNVFYPLDGQQRLTTLWLLHWFIACKAGKLDEAKKALKKFSYETRTSSREFCEKLCDFDVSEIKNVSEAVQKQIWFFSAWKQDPTIQSMLRMLEGTDIKNKGGKNFIDGIEECFLEECKFEDLWEKLINNNCPIKFSKLEINSAELPVSDDLYIKMNARGKVLTDFENFKADLISSMDNDESVKYANLIDNAWTDIFWNKNEFDIFDVKWMAFLCRSAVCIKIEKSEGTNEQIAEELKEWCVYTNDTDKSFFYAYNNFRDFQNVFNENLIRLDNIFKGWKKLLSLEGFSLASVWKVNFDFIPSQKEKTVSTLTMKTRAVFYGTMLFCEKCGEDEISSDDKLIDKWNAWKRVIWNLAENTNESSTLDGFVGVIKMFKQLGKGCTDIHNYLIQSKEEIRNFNFDQLKEELEKAKQIVNPVRDGQCNCCGPCYEKIQEAEKFAFFKGAIRFLYTDGDGSVNWGDFDEKFKNAKRYFDENGVSSKYRENSMLLRAFLGRIKKVDDGMWFGNNCDFWRNRVLLDDKFSDVVSDLLQAGVGVNNVIPHNAELPTWISDETLLSEVLGKDPNAGWHIITGWQQPEDKTLTRYARREKGNVSHPEQIIPLNDFRNEILLAGGICSTQRINGTRFFYGWDVVFEYEFDGKKYKFKWTAGDYVYILKNGKDEKVPEESNKYFCFKVDEAIKQIDDTKKVETFKNKLIDLIKRMQ